MRTRKNGRPMNSPALWAASVGSEGRASEADGTMARRQAAAVAASSVFFTSLLPLHSHFTVQVVEEHPARLACFDWDHLHPPAIIGHVRHDNFRIVMQCAENRPVRLTADIQRCACRISDQTDERFV